MNRKFLCGILACVMAFGTVFPLAACKDKPEQEQGGTQGGNQGGNQGSGENNNQNGGTIKPGTVITDQSMKSELYGSLSETQLGGFTYSASANLSVTGEMMEQAQKIIAEGAVVVKDSKVQADVSAAVSGSDGEEEVNQYLILFLRNETLYLASGDEKSENGVDFSALKAQLKDKDEPLVLAKEELGGIPEDLLETPALIKMIKNVPSLFDGVVTKTEGGFSLEFDLIGAVESLFDGLATVAMTIEETASMTLGNLFGHPFFKTTLEKLLSGITAAELKDALEKFLPEEIADALPDASEAATAYSYADGLLRSGSFYQALTQEGEDWSDWKTFAEIPLEGLISLFTGEEFSFVGLELQKMLKEYKEKFVAEAVSLLMDLINLGEGELTDENIAFTLGFAFDEDKKLLGFSVDALVEGSKILTAEEEDETPEDETPEDMLPGEGETTAQVAKTETEHKIDVRGIVKIEAAIVSAPELYDLTGCKYYTENGGTATISAKN